MAPTHKKRLLLLCGAGSWSRCQLASADRPRRSWAGFLPSAQRQESCFIGRHHDPDGRRQPGVRSRQVRPGDLCVGRRGRVNRVMRCERTVLGARRLYALNGGRPFVTAEHPFLTAEGWKALDPEATRRENASMLAALQLGDQLVPRSGARRERRRGPGSMFLQRRDPRGARRAGADPSTRCSTCCWTATTATSPTAGSCTTRMAYMPTAAAVTAVQSDGGTATASPSTIPCRDAGTCSGPSRQLRGGCGTARLADPSIHGLRHGRPRDAGLPTERPGRSARTRSAS